MPKTLDGKRKDYYMMSPFDVEVIGLDTKDGPEHPLYDERVNLPLSEALVLSIMYQGVLEPIRVRKDGESVQVVFGRQRVRACREATNRLMEAGKPGVDIPVMNSRGTDKDVFGVMISENENRQDDSPLAKAKKVQRFLDMGASEEEAAIVMGVTTKSIANWLSLLDCDIKVQKAVESGEISASAAIKLSSLKRTEQAEELKNMLESGRTSIQEAAARARNKKEEEKTTLPFKSRPPEEGVLVPPSKRTLKKVILHVDQGYVDIDQTAIKLLRWVMGLTGPQTVKGLTKALNLIEREAEEKALAKEEKAKKQVDKSSGKGKRKKSPPRVEGGE